MAVDVDCDQLYCTTSEVHFGPVCANYEEAEELRFHAYRTMGDPRGIGFFGLARILDEIRGGVVGERPTVERKL